MVNLTIVDGKLVYDCLSLLKGFLGVVFFQSVHYVLESFHVLVLKVLVLDPEPDGAFSQLLLQRFDQFDQSERVGLQIVGRRLDDAGVLRAATAFEAACPWADYLASVTVKSDIWELHVRRAAPDEESRHRLHALPGGTFRLYPGLRLVAADGVNLDAEAALSRARASVEP